MPRSEKMDQAVPAGHSQLSLIPDRPLPHAYRREGVSGLSATTILKRKLGTDMSRFPDAGHLLAWAGML